MRGQMRAPYSTLHSGDFRIVIMIVGGKGFKYGPYVHTVCGLRNSILHMHFHKCISHIPVVLTVKLHPNIPSIVVFPNYCKFYH